MHLDVYLQSIATQPSSFNMKIIFIHLFIVLLTSHFTTSDWTSEWMNPVQDQFKGDSLRRFDEHLKLVQVNQESREVKRESPYRPGGGLDTVNLKVKLEETLRTAKMLAETLRVQILELMDRETKLKEAITNGRSGVSTLTVSTLNQVPRSYIIREGRWLLCNGMIQFPVPNQAATNNLFSGLFSEPRCIGREVPTAQDPCVFNSVTKYDVVPTVRAVEYTEDEFLCLRTAFNRTFEHYMSVTRQLLNKTCQEGVIRTVAENKVECGVRVLSEYSFYPHRSSAAALLPLEYCTEKDGSCKLIVAWHISNATIENFEFLKNDQGFKKYFIKNGPYIEHII